MKKLYLIISVMFLGTINMMMSLVNQTFSQMSLKDQYVINWLSNNDSLEYETNYFRIAKFCFFRTINVGNFDISKYKTVSLLDPNKESVTATAWGKNVYYGDALRNKLNNLLISNVFIANKNIKTQKDLENDWRMELLILYDTFWLASMYTSHHIGFSYFSENGNNYIQVFIKQFAETSFSFSSGIMWTNLGRGLIFTSE